jgi:hypothetical protein
VGRSGGHLAHLFDQLAAVALLEHVADALQLVADALQRVADAELGLNGGSLRCAIVLHAVMADVIRPGQCLVGPVAVVFLVHHRRPFRLAVCSGLGAYLPL